MNKILDWIEYHDFSLFWLGGVVAVGGFSLAFYKKDFYLIIPGIIFILGMLIMLSPQIVECIRPFIGREEANGNS